MKIIISPAKRMRADADSLAWQDLPQFLHQTEQLLQVLKKLSPDELQRLWKCNDKILSLNLERLKNMDLYHRLSPAILAYEGIQYQHMAPGVFTDREFSYIQNHLRILSGFYGILKPFDGVTPYRLEMQTKLRVGEEKDLYAFWADRLAKTLCSESDCILNLASKEYSVCISKYLPRGTRFITCIFGEEKEGRIIEKGTMCKMARGEMIRYMAENQITSPEEIKYFDRLNYYFSHKNSNEIYSCFCRKQPEVDMINCISVENMRQSDAYTISNFVPSLELMYRAAWGVFKAVTWNSPIAIVAGSGNNGGDGFALACILKEHGFECTVFSIGSHFSDDSAYYAEKAKKAGIAVLPYQKGCLQCFSMVVDCLLGTGFQGTIRPNYQTIIEEINKLGTYVISVDINSGMNGNTGEAEIAVYSDLTVTVGYVKTGLISQNAGTYMKRLVCADIGIVLTKEEYKICAPDEELSFNCFLCPHWLDMQIIDAK